MIAGTNPESDGFLDNLDFADTGIELMPPNGAIPNRVVAIRQPVVELHWRKRWLGLDGAPHSRSGEALHDYGMAGAASGGGQAASGQQKQGDRFRTEDAHQSSWYADREPTSRVQRWKEW